MARFEKPPSSARTKLAILLAEMFPEKRETLLKMQEVGVKIQRFDTDQGSQHLWKEFLLKHATSDEINQICDSILADRSFSEWHPQISSWKSKHTKATSTTHTHSNSSTPLVIVQDIPPRVSLSRIEQHIGSSSEDNLLLFRAPIPALAEEWRDAAQRQREEIEGALKDRTDDPVLVFSIAPIPLMIHLGHVLLDRVDTELHHYDRVRKSWSWPSLSEGSSADLCHIYYEGIPRELATHDDVIFRISLSETVSSDLHLSISADALVVDIYVDNPNRMWLKHAEQLTALHRTYIEVLDRIRERTRGVRRYHILYAGPPPGAILLGQCLTPRRVPVVYLYEYSEQADPQCWHVLTLKDTSLE